jgi:hypothetical protein
MTRYDTIQDVFNALVECDEDALVFVDNRPPTALSSYRGYYDHLAIERSSDTHSVTALDEPGPGFDGSNIGIGYYTPGHGEVSIKSPPTVAELKAALVLAVGSEFEGYKGGQYRMWWDTQLWVSEYGNCDRLRVSGVEKLDGRVDLVTKESDW